MEQYRKRSLCYLQVSQKIHVNLYITGAKTTVFSDHKPLKNFFEGGMNIAKLDRGSLELQEFDISLEFIQGKLCLLYTSPSPRDATLSRMPSSA